MQAGPKKDFEPDPNPKNSPKGPEKCKEAQKKLYYNNGSVNIRYHGKQMTSLKDLLL